ncbi:MAG: peroxiredoxin family protein [Cyclobacteriaceae bacterium]
MLDTTAGQAFYNFNRDQLLGCHYYIKYNEGTQHIYNGKELFDINSQSSTIIYEDSLTYKKAINSFLNNNGPVFLKNFFNYNLFDNDNITILQTRDTTINNKNLHIITFETRQAYLHIYSGQLISSDKNYKYSIFIDKVMKLPYRFKEDYGPEYNGYREITFTNYQFPQGKPDIRWFLEDYKSDHLILSDKEYALRRNSKIVKVNTIAPEFELPILNGDKFSSDAFKDKLTLIKFWFVGCRGCVAAIPEFNEMVKNYQNTTLQIVGIETLNTPTAGLADYQKSQGIHYTILHSGKEVAEKYGAYFKPMIVLVGPDQKVLYAGEYNYQTTLKMIDNELAKMN